MSKDFKSNVTEFFKNGVQSVMEPMSRVEKDLKDLLNKLASQKIPREEIKMKLVELLAKVGDARKDIERSMEEGIGKAFSALNIPTRAEVDALAKQVNKLNSEIRKLASAGIPAVKAAKPVVKPAKAKAAAPAKKTVKKPVSAKAKKPAVRK